VALKEEYASRSRALAEEGEAVRDARHASQEALAERIAARDTAEAAMVLAEETYKRERERMDTVLTKAVSVSRAAVSPCLPHATFLHCMVGRCVCGERVVCGLGG
jgi:hypothetical protein